MASIRERTSKAGETTWAVLYRHGKKQRSLTFSTPKAAQKFKTLVELLGPEKAVAEMNAAGSGPGLTLDDLAEKFLEWKAGDVTVRTIADYRRDYENWIQPFLGHRQADVIDELDVQEWVDQIKGRLDPKSVKDRHAILSGIYRFGCARSRRLVEHNPCGETELPKKRKKAPRGATPAERLAIIQAANRLYADAGDLITFLATTGWRFSEATALTVAAVEDDGGAHAYAAVERVWRRDDQSRAVLVEDAKSYAGQRTTRLTKAATAIVRRRVVGKGPHDLVFTNRYGRRWHQSNFLHRTWTAVLAEAQLERRITPHHLRHSAVATADRAGASLPQIKNFVGHEDISTTANTYGGMIADFDDTILDRMDDLIFGRAAARDTVEGEIVEGVVIAGELD